MAKICQLKFTFQLSGDDNRSSFTSTTPQSGRHPEDPGQMFKMASDMVTSGAFTNFTTVGQDSRCNSRRTYWSLISILFQWCFYFNCELDDWESTDILSLLWAVLLSLLKPIYFPWPFTLCGMCNVCPVWCVPCFMSFIFLMFYLQCLCLILSFHYLSFVNCVQHFMQLCCFYT